MEIKRMYKIKRVPGILLGNILRTLKIPTYSVASPGLAVGTWVRELKQGELPPLRGSIAILLARNPTWVEWGIYAACWSRKLGLAPILLYSGKEISKIYGSSSIKMSLRNWLLQKDLWKTVTTIPDVFLCDIDLEAPPNEAALQSYGEFVEDWAHTSTAYDLYVEEYEQGSRQKEYSELLGKKIKEMIHWGALTEKVLKRFIKDNKIQRLVSYSGLIGVSSVVGHAARRVGLDVVFVEGWNVKPGIMICNLNAPALDWDPRLWLRKMDDWDEQQTKIIEQFLTFQETNKVTDPEWLEDHLKYQRSSVNDELDGSIQEFLADNKPMLLMAPNVIADSGTMRRALIFRSQREWITETCKFFRGHPEFKLIIRAHPAEYRMLKKKKLKIMIGDIALEATGGAENIRVIQGCEDVSTYSLIPYANAGIVWLSNVGVDMVIRNCPVVSVARAKYHGLGIAYEPKNKEDYFSLITKLAKSRCDTSSKQKEMGKKYISILYRKRSFNAFGSGYRASNIHLAGHSPDSDCEKFYKIVIGDLPIETTPSNR